MNMTWLFPGGKGGYTSLIDPKPDLAAWMERIIRYYDGRFATDQLWCVFAVNYLQRNINQKSGGFFVEGFHKGVTSLSDLQEQTRSGNLSWVDKIAYYSNRVIGSSACQRFSHDLSWFQSRLVRFKTRFASEPEVLPMNTSY